VAKPLGGSQDPPEAWMISPDMVEVKGCPTWRRQGKGITTTIALTITVGSHCSAIMTSDHAGCLPPRKNATDMVEPVRCSSLMLQSEEQEITAKQRLDLNLLIKT
jgi:hypothetical protein